MAKLAKDTNIPMIITAYNHPQNFESYIETICKNLNSENDKEFLQRSWGTNFPIYQKRIKALGFKNMPHILDAGCGYGQWSAALACVNEKITGIDLDKSRINLAKQITNHLGYKNLNFEEGSIEETQFEDNSLDGIFSYSVIYNTDYRKYLREFYRILKPGGLMYFSTNGLGWYIDSLINNFNSNKEFSTTNSAMEAIENSLNFYSSGKYEFGLPLIMKSNIVRRELKEIGFKVIDLGPDASINFHIHKCKSFFKRDFQGHEYVWEALCKKT